MGDGKKAGEKEEKSTHGEENSQPKSAMLKIGSGRRPRERSLLPVNLRAFRALMDRADEGVLREKLSRAEFFRLKRHRICIAWKYVRRISHNSEVAMAYAIIARQSPDVDVVAKAREVAELAWQQNVHCLVAFAKLTVEYMFPAICLRRNKLLSR